MAEFDPSLAEPDTVSTPAPAQPAQPEFDTVQTSAGPMRFAKTMSDAERQAAMKQVGVTPAAAAPTAAFDPSLAEPDVAMTKSAQPGAIERIVQAGMRGAKESATQQGLRDLVTPAGGYGPVGTAIRETALAPLEAIGTLNAPGAAIGGMAGEAVKQGAEALLPESMSEANDPTGSQMNLLKKLPGALGSAVDFGVNMLLPSGVATGGVSRLLHGWGTRIEAKSMGGATGIVKKGIGEVTHNPTAADKFMEDAGQRLSASQREASASARAAASKLRGDAIASVPTNATIANSASNVIRDSLPESGVAGTTAQRKLDKIARELEPTIPGMPSVVGGRSFAGANPNYVKAVLGALGQTTAQGAGRNVTFAELAGRREALSRLARDASSDADKRLYQFAISAVDKDIDTFGQKYPQAATMYRQFQEKYAGAVAQYHAREAPLRNLVDNTPPSEMMKKLRNLDLESIRNIKNGIVAGPNGMQAMEQIKSGVIQNLIESSMDPVTQGFSRAGFLKQFTNTDNVRKLREILGDRYAQVAAFRDAIDRAGPEKFPQASGMVKMMGAYQAVTAAEQVVNYPRGVFYHAMRAATIYMAPKLFGKMLENQRGAKLLAAGLTTKAGTPQAAMISNAMVTMARGMGAHELRALPAASSAAATELPHQAAAE